MYSSQPCFSKNAPRQRHVGGHPLAFAARHSLRIVTFWNVPCDNAVPVHNYTHLLWGICTRAIFISTQASVRLYKAFIRPTLEYGLQLEMINEKWIDRLERVQCTALRTIFSAPLNTSIDVLHRLTCLESMRLRNTILQFQLSKDSIHHRI